MQRNRKNIFTTKALTFSAASIAIAFILSLFTVFKMPQGGSVKLFSMFFVCLPGYFFGPVIGILSSVSYGILDLILNPYITHPAQLILDYILAYGALGLSGFFMGKKHGLYLGYLTGVFGRFVFSTLSGVIFFYMYAGEQNVWVYSSIYQIQYIGIEAAITMVVILLPVFKNGIERVRRLVVN